MQVSVQASRDSGRTLRAAPARLARLITITLLALPATGCDDLYRYFFLKLGEPDPCDEAASVYEGERHFFEQDYLNKDGTINYEKWLEVTDPQRSPCDPLRNHDPL